MQDMLKESSISSQEIYVVDSWDTKELEKVIDGPLNKYERTYNLT
jgi:hypothetical protein